MASATELEEIRKRNLTPFPQRRRQSERDVDTLLTHIAALEAENELVRRCYSGLKAFALDVSRDPLNHWSGAAQRLLDTGVYDRAEKAEAQLATRLPTRTQLWTLLVGNMGLNTNLANADDNLWRTADAILALLSGAATPAPTAALTEAARDVLAERQRQISAEGWTPDHDDKHHTGDMARAASAYALASSMSEIDRADMTAVLRRYIQSVKYTAIKLWPWEWEWFKPKTPRHDLVRAAALCIAEIERLDRAKSTPQGAEE